MPTKSKKTKKMSRTKKNTYNFSKKIIVLLLLLVSALFLILMVNNQQSIYKINADDHENRNREDQDHDDSKNNPKISQQISPQITAQVTTVQNVTSNGSFLQFDPASQTVKVGDQVNVKVVVNTAGHQTLSSDAYVLYNNTNLQFVSVQNGDFFPSVTFTNSSSSIVVRGMVTEPASYREGIGILATITFKALQNGTVPLSYYCNTQAGDTSKIIENNIDAQNIMDCAANQTATIIVGSGGGTTISPGPTSGHVSPTKKPTPTKNPRINDNILKAIIAIILVIFVILMIILGI